MIRLVSRTRAAVVPDGSKPRTIEAGVLRGIKLEINYKYQTQLYLGAPGTRALSLDEEARTPQRDRN